MHHQGCETKLFDPRDPSTEGTGVELTDASIVERQGGWRMILAGQKTAGMPTDLYMAALDPGAPLAAIGWRLIRDGNGDPVPLCGRQASAGWDGQGGRHCPSYVRGWDAAAGREVERIYYAGAAQNSWGPYAIGFLEWDGEAWVDQSAPAFVAEEEWERGSVYEPNLIYHDGKWRMWYVAGSTHEKHIVQGYAESADGRTGWSRHEVFAPAEMTMFDFCVRRRGDGYEAIFARLWLGDGPPSAETGLWWCHSPVPSGRLADWGEPVRVMSAAEQGWHSAPWKPSFGFAGEKGRKALIFFDGCYRTDDPGPFPFVFTVGCLETELPMPA
jgi:hypothetical protein